MGSSVPLWAFAVLAAGTIGLLAGLGGRGFAWLLQRAKSGALRVPIWLRVGVAGVVLGVLALLSDLAFDEPLTLGGGVHAMTWVVDPSRALPLIALLFGMRIAATLVTIGGGGVGGLFIPLASLGVIVGQFVGAALGNDTGLYPTLGLAAFLGAGYRTPIAAVVFVAEATTGSFVVPALVAAAVSQLVAGPTSVSSYQRSERLGHVERRFTLPLTSILKTDVLTVPPDATVSEFVYNHVLGRRERTVPVVDANTYLGMVTLDHVNRIDRDEWETTLVRDAMDTSVAARPSWTLRDAVATMEEEDVELLAVADANDNFVGIVSQADIVLLDEILDETGG
ncbi:MAG: chloride channel protein [Acidobacteria bacterium]|nr:chloride channel protein [Acidobacteriota bacterium]